MNDFDPVDPVEPEPSILDPNNPRDAAALLLLEAARGFCGLQDDDRPVDDRYFEEQAQAQVDALGAAGWAPSNTDVRQVLEYVSRGRRFVDVEPYPDSLARRALGAMMDGGQL